MPKLTSSIADCARCGNEHLDLEFAELVRPIELAQRAGGGYAIKITHWAPCPMTGEPVLMRFSPESDAG